MSRTETLDTSTNRRYKPYHRLAQFGLYSGGKIGENDSSSIGPESVSRRAGLCRGYDDEGEVIPEDAPESRWGINNAMLSSFSLLDTAVPPSVPDDIVDVAASTLCASVGVVSIFRYESASMGTSVGVISGSLVEDDWASGAEADCEEMKGSTFGVVE